MIAYRFCLLKFIICSKKVSVKTPRLHRQQCANNLEVLQRQRDDLSLAIDQLLDDLSAGRKTMKVYKQMKMYNDEALNPVLYSSKTD